MIKSKSMEVMLVEPLGHYEGHPSGYPKYLSRALSNTGANVAMATFAGLLGERWEDVKIKHISVLTEGSIFAFLARLLRGFLHVIRPLRPLVTLLETFFTFLLALRRNSKQKYDVIHILDASILLLSFLAFASVVKNCCLVLTISGPPIEQYHGASLRERILVKLHRSKFISVVNRFLYRRATVRNQIAFVCHSKQVQDSYTHSIFYDKLQCIPWGMEESEKRTLTQYEARQYLGLPQGEKLFLSFGINHPRKNFEVIFQAVQDLSKDFKLIFAGEIVPRDAEQNDPRRFAQEYGWTENTIIANKFISEEEMPYYFCAADAMLLSYRKDFIGASGILSHAAGFGLPVIASDIGQLGEFVKSYKLGLTFVPEDPHSLREVILSFLNLGEEQKQAMKKNLAQFVSTHSWEQVAKEHLELYQNLSEEAK